MSVTVEQVQAVVDALVDEPREWEYDEATRQLLAYKDLVKFRAEVDASPHSVLARQMYDRVKTDGNPEFEDQNPKNGRHWLQAAEAAQAILAPKREPRTFTDEEPEPTDVKYIRDDDGDLFRYVSPNSWRYKTAGGYWGVSPFRWSEVAAGKGATEDLEYSE